MSLLNEVRDFSIIFYYNPYSINRLYIDMNVDVLIWTSRLGYLMSFATNGSYFSFEIINENYWIYTNENHKLDTTRYIYSTFLSR